MLSMQACCGHWQCSSAGHQQPSCTCWWCCTVVSFCVSMAQALQYTNCLCVQDVQLHSLALGDFRWPSPAVPVSQAPYAHVRCNGRHVPTVPDVWRSGRQCAAWTYKAASTPRQQAPTRRQPGGTCSTSTSCTAAVHTTRSCGSCILRCSSCS